MKRQSSSIIEFSSIVLIALIAWCVETRLLMAILHHPAGPPAQAVDAGPHAFFGVAALPFVAVALTWLAAGVTRRRFRASLFALLIGLVGSLFAMLALYQFGHATPGFLMAGYFGQWILFCRYALTR